MKELDLIRHVRELCPPSGDLETGIGDDAAVIRIGAETVVLTTDMLVEGVHFLPDDPPRDVGWKALAVSVSDVAAMGAKATAAVIAVALRPDVPDDRVRDLLAGIRAAAAAADVPLAGGDTTGTSGPLTITSTVLGRPLPGKRPVLRSGARPGQALLVTGSLGGSLAGRHLRFVPRQAEALTLVERATPGAMIDLSDGLSTDAWHLARESGVTLRIRADRVPVSDAARAADDGRSGLDHALTDGEDFELLFTVSETEAAAIVREGLAGTPVTRIGEVAPGGPAVVLVDADGDEEPLPPRGWEHLR
jgi:thiamine-monophosphate kinase